MMAQKFKFLLGRGGTKVSSVTQRKLSYVAIHRVNQLPGAQQVNGVALGFGKDGLRVLDGVVDQSRVNVVEANNVQPWMSGIRWDLVQTPGGNWCLLNQGLHSAALTAVGETAVLGRVDLGWPSLEQSWRLFRREDGRAYMLRNQAGGWLSLTEEGPVMLRRQIDTSDESLFWQILDAAPMLHNLPNTSSVAM